jgi:hypothetical protein
MPYCYDDRATRAGCCLPLGKRFARLSSAQSVVEQGHAVGETLPSVPVSTLSHKVAMNSLSKELASTAIHDAVPEGLCVHKNNRPYHVCLRIMEGAAHAHGADRAPGGQGALIGADQLTKRCRPSRTPVCGTASAKARRAWLTIAVQRTRAPVCNADPDTNGTNRLPVQSGTGAAHV